MFLCLFFVLKKRQRKRGFLKRTKRERGVRKTHFTSTKEALTKRTFEYGRSTRECVTPYASWKFKKKKKVLRDEIVLKGRRDFHLYSVTLDFISVQRTNTKSALIITTTT